MDEPQKMEWSKAQDNITFSIDLVGAANKHLRFLDEVDRTGYLYDGPALERAIYRYKHCWLPLLAKNMNSLILERPLVVPLDCEWIWHCHRLNPIQYKHDCEEVYGKVLDKLNVLSTTEGASSKETEALWNRIYVAEPYNIDHVSIRSPAETTVKSQKKFKYDLVAAVQRQSSFFQKVSKMMNCGDIFLEEAVDRYKGFMHLIKIIKERKLVNSCVPTHDIDFIWHTHQLYPVAYCKDMKTMHGKVIDHNDRDSEPEMMKYHFSKTEELWEDTFGSVYNIIGSVLKNKLIDSKGSGEVDAGCMVCAIFCDAPPPGGGGLH